MTATILRRLIQAIMVMVAMTMIVFLAVNVIGDPVTILIAPDADQIDRARLVQELGLDRPLLVQYLDFLRDAPRGDFGLSIRERRPAMRMVLEHFWPATVQLALAAIVLAVVLPIPLGIIAATHRRGALDHLSRLGSLFLQSMPSFWLGLMLILLFAVGLGGLLPAFGSHVAWRSNAHLPRRGRRPVRQPHPDDGGELGVVPDVHLQHPRHLPLLLHQPPRHGRRHPRPPRPERVRPQHRHRRERARVRHPLTGDVRLRGLVEQRRGIGRGRSLGERQRG